jgi:hypothetical protein
MANITQGDIFGPDDSASAPVPVPDSVTVDSSPLCSDDELELKSCGKHAGKAPSRVRLTMQQKLKGIEHLEKNRKNQTELGAWMYKNMKFKRVSSKGALSKMLKQQEHKWIKAFAEENNQFMLQKKV